MGARAGKVWRMRTRLKKRYLELAKGWYGMTSSCGSIPRWSSDYNEKELEKYVDALEYIGAKECAEVVRCCIAKNKKLRSLFDKYWSHDDDAAEVEFDKICRKLEAMDAESEDEVLALITKKEKELK